MSDQPERSSVTVRIAGEEHTIRAAAEPEYTESCARYVDQRISEIRRRSGLLESHKAAILAALSISDECFQAREELERLRKEVVSRTTNLERRIEGELQREESPSAAASGEPDGGAAGGGAEAEGEAGESGRD